MELDVHLTREGDEPWGFDFIGGADYPIPLTIDKVEPASPAAIGGLQLGDVVARLGDRLATELSQEAARDIVAEAVGSLSFGICRGLYDPVLDDYEPIYEPIDRADSDLRSEPTEVQFPTQCDPNDLSLDDPNILDPRITDPSLWDSGYGPLTESRSLTASPFVPNTKPYRPFSTEPLEVPPLDDPIILNPNFNDTFNLNEDLADVKTLQPGEDELLRLLPLDKDVEAKFKLPVSEKYDPEWDKKVKALLERCAEGGKRETRSVEQELACYASEAMNVAITKEMRETVDVSKKEKRRDVKLESSQISTEKVKFEEKMREEINMQTIEQVAEQVVEESIERAVSVAKEIQNEIEEELRASMTRELQVEETENKSEVKANLEDFETKIESKESIVTSEVTESNVLEESKLESETEMKLTAEEKIVNERLIKDEQFAEERRLSNKREMEEIIETGNVKRKSSTIDKEERTSAIEVEKETNTRKVSTQQQLEEAISLGTVKRQSVAFEKIEDDRQIRDGSSRKVSHADNSKSEHVKEFMSFGTSNAETKQSESKQKAYMIGLQTIPHIKGFVQSSYHFDLLLRTFFVHLTDVMVALSRFILTQPATELEGKAEKVIKEKLIKEFATQDTEHYVKREAEQQQDKRKQSVQMKQEKDMRAETKIVEAKHETKAAKVHQEIKKETQEMQHVKHEIKSKDLKTYKEVAVKDQASEIQESLDMSLDEVDSRKKSGVEMAQRTQKKSKDLTNKMNAVITEFETKAGIEDRLEVTEQSRRRSRSRSQVEEEVMRESDPLEWLDKVDSRRASQERTDITSVKKEFSTLSESKESRKTETKRESRSTKVKPGKQMYIAIVESHVYTNQDAILEDQVAEMSETASVQSSEEINAASESFEAFSTENVAMTNVVQSEEKQQAVEVITNALQEVVQEKQEVLEAVSDFKSQITEEHSKSVMQESHASVATESTEIVSESKVKTFEAKEVKESKALTVQEESYKTAAVEFVDVPLEAVQDVVIEKAIKQEAVLKQEQFTAVAAEVTEVITDESKLQSFESKEVVSKKAVVSTEENYKATGLSTKDIVLEASKEEIAEVKVSKQQAVVKAESLAIAVAESTDVVVDDSKVETFESKELVSKKAKIASEETFKTAAVGTTEVTFEIAEDKHSERAKTSQVTIKEECQHLAVAGIIETKTEVCKEPRKPAEDEYASLKIVKEQIIDGGESVEISTQSELNVKTLDIETSSEHVQSSKESYQSITQTSSIQESFRSSDKSSKLHLQTDLAQQLLQRQTSDQSDENNNTPTPSVPPTPLTDEYVFKLEIPLPKNQGTVVVEESPDREDPHIVKKGLVPYIETTIEEQIIYDPPLPTPPVSPVYTKPGLRGGEGPLFKKEYIREIERKSSLLASAIDETIKSIEEYKEEVGIENEVTIKLPKRNAKIQHPNNGQKLTNGFTNGHENNGVSEEAMKKEWCEVDIQVKANNENIQQLSKSEGQVERGNETEDRVKESDVPPGFKPVVFNPEDFQARLYEEVTRGTEPEPRQVTPFLDESGTPLGTVQGIVDGLEDATVDEEVAKELGKPGLTEDKIAELISGESEMLREAHIMGLSRVITSHMTRADDSSVDFQKIKPLVESLKDSEVLKALNEELLKEKQEEKKKDEKKWTTFLQKPKRPVPRAKFGYPGAVEPEDVDDEEPYRVKIVKQPKPKVAPDYKPEDFDTGPLPWEQRALLEPEPSPQPPEEPILVPEESPEFLEAVDPLPESEVPDLEDTGIPLPPSPPPTPPEEAPPSPDPQELPPDPPEEIEEPPPPKMHDVEQNQMAEQLVNTVKGMVDPNASLEQQLAQMRAQLAALAQLPCVIQQSLEMLTRQLSTMGRQECRQVNYEAQMNLESHQQVLVTENTMESIPEYQEPEVQSNQEGTQNQEEQSTVTIEEVQETPTVTAEEIAAKKREEQAMIEEQERREKEKKAQQELIRRDQESRQVKQRAPRVGKPKPVFGPLSPEDRPQVLPGGRRWRGPKDAYNEQFIAETLQAQSEILQGKVMGINFMKYEKPPVNLDHLQNSATYKLIHNMEQEPLRRVDLRTPVVAEADYRERCRSATPNVHLNGRM